METANVAQSEGISRMDRMLVKRIAKCLMGILIVVIAAIGVVCVVPTEIMRLRNVELIERSILADMSIPKGILEFVAARFRRESIIIFQLPNDAISDRKLSNFTSSQQRKDAAKRIAEAAHACGLRIDPSPEDNLMAFQGADYSVIYMNSSNVAYLVYLGAQ